MSIDIQHFQAMFKMQLTGEKLTCIVFAKLNLYWEQQHITTTDNNIIYRQGLISVNYIVICSCHMLESVVIGSY